MRYSLGILKPDCIKKDMVEKVCDILRNNRFHIVAKKQFRFEQADVDYIYERCQNSDFFEGLSEFLKSGDSVVLIVENCSEDAIEKLNSVVGHTNPKLAKSGTVRKLGENVRYNLMHSTANESTFWKEISHLFSQEELSKIGCE